MPTHIRHCAWINKGTHLCRCGRRTALFIFGPEAYDVSWTVEVEMKDTIMWMIGIVLALLAAGLMVWSDTDVAPLTVLLILGITFIAIGARGRRSQHH